MIHAFTYSGVLPSQYTRYSEFSGIGVVGHNYVQKGSALIYISNFCIDKVIKFCSVQADGDNLGGAVDGILYR